MIILLDIHIVLKICASQTTSCFNVYFNIFLILSEHSGFQVVLHPVTDMTAVHNCLHSHLSRHNEELGNIKLDIMLSDHIVMHIVKLHRILTLHHRYPSLLVPSAAPLT